MKKYKACKICRNQFQYFNSTQKVCSPYCAIKLVRINENKKFRKETRDRKEALKSKSDWLNEAQTAFNQYIRLRDRDEPCISCGTTKTNVQYCAGHYFTRGGHPELRFSELNVHKQCNKNCNRSLSGNIAAYRVNLLKKIGAANLEWLEGPHRLQKLTIEDAKEIKAYYKQQTKLLKDRL